MVPTSTKAPLTRREFVRLGGISTGLVAFGPWVPEFLPGTLRAGAVSAVPDQRALVLVHLSGGNDGINTIIPMEDDAYFQLRPTLAIPRQRVIRHSSGVGFHPSAKALWELMETGKLCVVQNVGYPNPSRNHLSAGRAWQTATDQVTRSSSASSRSPHADDITRSSLHCPTLLVNRTPKTDCYGVNAFACGTRSIEGAAGPPHDTEGRECTINDHTGPVSAFLHQTKMDTPVFGSEANRFLSRNPSAQKYPFTPFAHSLQHVAAQISTGQSAPIYFVSLEGFDTHSGQAARHAGLLSTLGEGLSAFQAHLAEMQLEHRVATFIFSEFGRSARENINRGTDHGTAAPAFLLSSALKCPVVGTPPRIDGAAVSDWAYETDFRQIYATLIDQWLGGDSSLVLEKRYPPLALF